MLLLRISFLKKLVELALCMKVGIPITEICPFPNRAFGLPRTWLSILHLINS
jgi:hypothetical protein